MGFGDFINTWLAPITSAASTALSFYGTQYRADAQSKGLEYNARMARINAQAAEERRQYDVAIEGQRADFEKDRQAKYWDKLKGSQIAAMAARGIDPGSSVFRDVLKESAYEEWLDRRALEWEHGVTVDAINYNAELVKHGLVSEAGLTDAQAGQVRRAGKISSAGTLLTGGYDLYRKGRDTGLWSSFSRPATKTKVPEGVLTPYGPPKG